MTKILTATIAAAVLTLGALAVSPNVEAARKPVPSSSWGCPPSPC